MTGVAGDMGASQGGRAGALGLSTVANAAQFPIIPVLRNGLGSLAALGRSPEPEPEEDGAADSDDGEPRYRAAPEGPRAIHMAGIAELWLLESPEGELRWGDERARELTLTLIDGWRSTVLHRLAAGPRTLAALDAEIEALDRDRIAACLEAMVAGGQLRVRPGPDGGEQLYELTEWGRRCVPALIAASRLESEIPDETDPIEPLDVEAAFALALPLLRLPGELSGSCALTVDIGGRDEPRPAGVLARFERGRLASCAPGVEQAADARVTGSAPAWFGAVIEARLDRMAAEGDVRLATAVLEALHGELFALEA